jgi:NAD(P)H-nitrite reductase large subunit
MGEVESLPGVDGPNVFSVEEVMRREARPGKRVLVLDDVGNWRGLGTAWQLADKGHEVTIITPDAHLGRELVRTGADIPLRARLAKLGVKTITESVITTWHGDGATIRSLLDGGEQRLEFDTLVLATVNRADTEVADELRGGGTTFATIGDCLAPRHAPAAIYEGRKLGLGM